MKEEKSNSYKSPEIEMMPSAPVSCICGSVKGSSVEWTDEEEWGV